MATVAQQKVPTPPRGGSPLAGDKALVERDTKLPELRNSDNSLDRRKPLPTSLQSDFLPDDILFALTQVPQSKDGLGPANKFRNLNTATSKTRPPPANVWNSVRKDRFKHLTENTPCICGAGKDISFLYDVPTPPKKLEKPDRIDKSVIRKEAFEPKKQALHLPDTLIPEEYHIVKNKGVLGIEHHEDKYSNQVEDHEKHLVVFPSMKPVSRFEVVQLQKTMEEMLERAGVNDAEVEIKGPTQMHNLLELIKKEQNIYNVVFHELIRQTSIECVERGELLADLRGKYSNLLNKVPQQIKSLHEEVMAQRALDRRLTEELMRFKSTISILTSELSEVKEHDKKVTNEAQQAQDDLKAALSEAQKNASLLAEYHELYELQRQRLESQVFMLTEEREIWSTAAYCLAMKVTEEAQLTTAKRLHVSEKAWAKLANHFTILLSDRDTDLLTKIQTHVEKWRDMVEEFSISQKHVEEEMRQQLRQLAPGINKWLDKLRTCFTKEGTFLRAPDIAEQKQLNDEIKRWEEMLSKDTDNFGGDRLLNCQEALHVIKQQMEGWTDNALKVFSRHRGSEGTTHPDQRAMMKLNEDVENLLHQFNTRITGENGVASNVIHVFNGMETWDMKLSSSITGTMPIHDNEWAGLLLTMEEWLAAIEDAVEVEVHDTVRKVQKWVTTATNAVDSEDAKLVEQVSTLHSEMIRWMVQVLLRLAPNKEGNSKEAGEMTLLGSTTLNQLHANAKSLFEQLEMFSTYVVQVATEYIELCIKWDMDEEQKLCCGGIVMDNTQMRRDQMEENADHELKDLQRLEGECQYWIKTAKILLGKLMNEPVESLFPPKVEPEKKQKSGLSLMSDQEYVDQEKLAKPVEGETKPQGEAKKEQDTMEKKKVEEGDKKEEEEEGEGGDEEEEEGDEKETPKSGEAKTQTTSGEAQTERLEVIGGDDNTHIQTLQQTPSKQFPAGGSQTVPQPPPPGQTSPSSGGPDPSKAFEALAAVEALQNQLMATEERAQAAQEKADNAEAELNVCLEKIREQAKRIAELEKSTEEKGGSEKTDDKQKTPSTPKTPTKPAGKEASDVALDKKRPDSQASKASSSKSSKSKKK